MDHLKELLNDYKDQILKAIEHLSYSYQKVFNLSPEIKKLNSSDLEAWEAFFSRFSRVSDIFLTKYIRTKILLGDPAFRGSLRDSVDQGEKLGLIHDAEVWMKIRELRNASAHEYTAEDLSRIFEEARKLTPILLDLENKITTK